LRPGSKQTEAAARHVHQIFIALPAKAGKLHLLPERFNKDETIQ
jgi:hypothetical protein